MERMEDMEETEKKAGRGNDRGRIRARAIIFDIDGTLIDTFEAYCNVFNRGIGAFGLAPVSREFLGSWLARAAGLKQILEAVFPAGVSDEVLTACMAEIKRVFLQVETEEVRPFKGVEGLFRHLKEKGIKIGIATGRTSTGEDEWRRFKRFGLDTFIEAIVTSRDVTARKPAPDVIVECARRLGVDAADCLAVGDTVADIDAARGAGAQVLAVTTGQEDPDRLKEAGPDLMFDDVVHLVAFLETVGGEEG